MVVAGSIGVMGEMTSTRQGITVLFSGFLEIRNSTVGTRTLL